ncbi:MAG: LysM peptidoglycan-binding domain-containing protein [Bacteroidales bacterium]|nr:LysM peptidoglycan-binding domain-containing protein [Bacteroidales bacterium]
MKSKNFFIFLSYFILCQGQDLLENPSYIAGWINYEKTYPFICYSKNVIEWYHPDAIFPFFEKLKNADNDKVVILHIGDSHVQSDVFTGVIRDRLQEIFGYGGRGYVFPYKAAKTNSAYDYTSIVEGEWMYTRNVEMQPRFPLSFSGITCKTTDSTAGFAIVFRKKFQTLRNGFNRIRIFCNTSRESMDLLLRTSSEMEWIETEISQNATLPYICLDLPAQSYDTLFFKVKKNKPEQKFFELYAIIIESTNDKGILYISTGINGAGISSLLKQNLAIEHLKYLKPDLVIIDVGINDIYRTAFHENFILMNLLKLIQEIRTNLPTTSMILVSPQNVMYRNINIPNCKLYSALIRRIAEKEKVALYDYFTVAGGDYSMKNWYAFNLAQRDKKHLTFEGYVRRGELFINAILNAYRVYLLKKPFSYTQDFFENDTLRVDTLVGCKKNIVNAQNAYTQSSKKDNSSQANEIIYVVQKGDNLSSIASKYGVSVADIQRWNNLQGTSIYPGQKLKIHSNSKTQATVSTAFNSPKNITHVVKEGESLWSIARKYNTTVEKIKKDNQLSSDKIQPGQKLIIK